MSEHVTTPALVELWCREFEGTLRAPYSLTAAQREHLLLYPPSWLPHVECPGRGVTPYALLLVEMQGKAESMFVMVDEKPAQQRRGYVNEATEVLGAYTKLRGSHRIVLSELLPHRQQFFALTYLWGPRTPELFGPALAAKTELRSMWRDGEWIEREVFTR